MDFRPQQQNANKHTARGQGRLENSISTDGFLTPITVVADGEAIDGSLRLETCYTLFPDAEPIVIRSRGDRPIIHIREDIPHANTPQAKRLSLSANRTAELSLDWDAEILEEWKIEGITNDFWLADEPKPWESEEVPNFSPVGEDEQGRLDQIAPKELSCKCPDCGYEFIQQY